MASHHRSRNAAIFGAVVVALIGGVTAGVLVQQIRPGTPSSRPTARPYAPFTVEVHEAGSVWSVTISSDADCASIRPSGPALEVCSLAILGDPAAIGGEAFGELNDRRTPALEALIWRARSDGRAYVCARGGLTGAFRAECEAEAQAERHEFADGPITIVVPRL